MTTPWQAAHAGFDAQVRAQLGTMPIFVWLGLDIRELAPGEATVAIPYRDEIAYRPGFVQAGPIGTLADITAGAACLTLAPEGASQFTVDYTIKLVGSTEGSLFIGRGRVVAAGKSLRTASADVFAVRDGREHLCATALASFRLLLPR